MKKSAKTLFATLITFGSVSMANAISPEAQEALNKTQITAAQALTAAQNKMGEDAKVKEIDFHHSKYGKDYFQVEMFGNNQRHKVDVDAASGEILGVQSKAPKQVKVRATQAEPKISFEQAMNTAVQKTGGKVAEADLHFRNGQGFYKIETVANGQAFVVAVNADNGEIMDMPMKHHKGKHGKKHHREHFEGGFHAEQGERPQQN